MVLNYVIPANLILELIMIGMQSAVYNHSYRRLTYARIDQTYLGLVVPFFVACFGWLMYFKEDDRYFTSWSRAVRAIQGVIMIIVGPIMIWSAELIEDDDICKIMRETLGDTCQLRELKITAGALALVDGVFYFLKPCKTVVQPMIIMASQLQPPAPTPLAVTVNVTPNLQPAPGPWYGLAPPPQPSLYPPPPPPPPPYTQMPTPYTYNKY